MRLYDLRGASAMLIVVYLMSAVVAGQSPGVPTTPAVSESTTAASGPASPEKRSATNMDTPIVMRSIGVIRSPYKNAKGTPVQGVFGGEVEAFVELKDKYVKGLKDLDGFSHAILLYYFHKSGKEEIVAKPYLEGEEHGIFAIRSPNRPNHIGLSVVKIKRIEGSKLHFTEVDVLDGTPVLDIKPYVKQFDSRPNAVSGWVEKHYEDGKQPAQRTAK
jgi:tRNA (adenine37-N6)-methyltransferase